MRFTIKKGDTRPALQIQCLNEEDDTPFNVTGLVFVFNMGIPGQARKVNNGAVTIVDALQGIIEHPWVVGETDTNAEYRAEFVGTAGGVVYTFPNYGYITVEVMEEV